MVDPRMAQATVVQMKIAMIAATRLNMVVVSRLSPPHPQPTSFSWHCQVLFIAKYRRAHQLCSSPAFLVAQPLLAVLLSNILSGTAGFVVPRIAQDDNY